MAKNDIQEWYDILAEENKKIITEPGRVIHDTSNKTSFNPTTFCALKPYSTNNEKNERAHQIAREYLQKRFDELGLIVRWEENVQYDDLAIQEHYSEHYGKSFYPGLRDLFISNKLIGMYVQTKDIMDNPLDKLRSIAGSTIKVNRKTNEIERCYEEGSIRYDLSFILYQTLEQGKDIKDVVIPKDEECQKVYNPKTNSVEYYKDSQLVNVANMTNNFIHTSGNYAEAAKELSVFKNAYYRDLARQPWFKQHVREVRKEKFRGFVKNVKKVFKSIFSKKDKTATKKQPKSTFVQKSDNGGKGMGE